MNHDPVKLDSQIPASILHNHEQSSVLELGLTPCSKPNWLAIDEDFANFHAHKLQQFEIEPNINRISYVQAY